ncbi:MAG: DUF1049 domain-containing protein [Rhizobiales bacterium]|nr:DUF1049 domain-containing protein [Hyphomicrobiales bacterium]
MALAIANRGNVLFSFDPFNPENPAIAIDVPLIAVVFAAMLIGILIGGVAGWGQARRSRVKARRAAELAAIRDSSNLPAAMGTKA